LPTGLEEIEFFASNPALMAERAASEDLLV